MSTELTVAVSATFTAEPIAPSLGFWLRSLGLSSRIEFAPYNQVFQQLLDPSSLVRANSRGASLLLVRFDDWLPQQASAHDHAATAAAEASHAEPDGERFRLPGGLDVFHLNRYETEYVYQEIFVDRAYVRHGITIEPGDCVIDIGANIGLFSMFVQSDAPGARVFAFEPSPPAFAALRRNVERYEGLVTAVPCGIGDRDTVATFTTYTRSSVFSSFHPDLREDRSAIRAVIRNVLEEEAGLDEGDTDQLADELVADRLEAEQTEVPVRSLSSLIRQHGLERIDLLKIDAEKSELAVLRGIEEDDWSRIHQIVIEVHDAKGDLLREVQSLLETRGFEVAVEEETLLRSSGLYNLYAIRADSRRPPRHAVAAGSRAVLRRNIDDFVQMVRGAASQLTAPLSIVLCPVSPQNRHLLGSAGDMEAIEQSLADALADTPGVSVTTSAEWLALYPVADLHDPQADRLGQIPYTPEGFAAIGTAAARRIHAAIRPVAKVIAVDCDHTLWTGVCAEDDPAGLTLDVGRRALQQFLIDQRAAGVLVCLCSKNEEDDVLRVFRERPDFLLTTDHLTAWRINWAPKSDNLRELARELGVGLDSFVFIDDNPVECAEVRGACPEVVTYQLPADADDVVRFLRHVWPLDRRRLTAEDRSRAEMYRQQIERTRWRDAAESYDAFIAGLGLDVQIEPLSDASLDRAAQLTERTNQFNFTTRRRTPGEIRALASLGTPRREPLEFLIVRVSDRFGDYGYVGLAAVAARGRTLVVDTFLLSCRVLGKGVEHRVLAHLGLLAVARGLTAVELPYVETRRNSPARRFAESLSPIITADEGRTSFTWSAADAAAVTFRPTSQPDEAQAAAPGESEVAGGRLVGGGTGTALLSRIPAELWTPAQVLAASVVATPATPGGTAARTHAERVLADLWAECLHLAAVSVDENFYELGGDSVRAVQIVSRARSRGLLLSARDVMDHPTIAALARLARVASADAGGPTAPRAGRPVDRPFSLLSVELRERLLTAAADLEDAYGLTPMQAMFHAQYSAGLDAGFEQWDFRLHGPLDPTEYRRAWDHTLARHFALRTSFDVLDGHVLQRVHRHASMGWQELDWRSLDVEEQDRQFRHVRAADKAARFDLTAPPLTRIALARTAEHEWRVLWTFHHLVVDGWSWPIIFRDVAAAYAGAPLDPHTPSASTSQFAAYVQWLRERPAVDDETFWARTLAGVAQPTRLLGSAQAPSAAYGSDGILDEACSSALHQLARRHRVTLGSVAAAAWALVLSHETAADDVVFGVTMTGRPPEIDGIEDMVGTFVSNVPVRVRTDRNASLGELFQAAHRSTVDVAEHQFLALDRIQATTPVPPRDRLFESLLVVQNYAGGDATAALWPAESGLTLSAMRMPTQTGYPVTVAVSPGREIGISLVARGDEGRRGDVRHWLDQLVGVLRMVSASDSGSVAQLLDRLPRPVARPAVRLDPAPRVPAVSPRTALEQMIASVWTEVFQHDGFSLDDNFFALGGHSLLMIRVHERLAALVGRPLSIVELFQYPTIGGLARRLSREDQPEPGIRAAQTRAQRQLEALGRRRPVGSKRT